MKLLTAAAMAAGLAFAGCANAAVNLVKNGSFEDGLADWDVVFAGDTNALGYSAAVVILTDGVARGYPNGAFNEGVPGDDAPGPFAGDGGNKAIYFSTDVGLESLTQLINLAEGWYEVGFDAYIPLNGYVNQYDATFTATVGTNPWDPVLLKGTAIGPQDWKHYSAKVFVSPAQIGSPTSFTFAANGYPAVDVLVDRVYIMETTAPVPEPGAWALMILGFGAAGATLRGQRRRTATA